MKKAKVIIAADSQEGHRREYIAQFTDILRAAGVDVCVRKLSLNIMFIREPLFSLMLEEHALKFAAIAVVRSLCGYRSVALMFRPSEALNGRSIRHRLKRTGLKLLIRLRAVNILTILPFSIRPEFAKIATGWIYDPQLWDLPPRNGMGSTELSLDLRAHTKGRRLLVALGGQSEAKGFDYLAAIWAASPELRTKFHFVACGRVAASSAESAARFVANGGQLVDRFLTDEEVLSAYDCADLVWSCYSPAYDQASGIFGRAVQMGRKVVVRSGSLIEDTADQMNYEVVTVPWAAPLQAAQAMIDAVPAETPTRASGLVEELREVSLRHLSNAFCIDLLGGEQRR